MSLFKGVGVAMVTPFNKSGDVNYDIFNDYLAHLILGGVNALIPLGTTGEPATVSDSEYEKVLAAITSKVEGRNKIIVGAGSNSTATAVKHVKTAKRFGVNGVLVVTPYYNKCTQNGLIEHYKAVADCGLPVIAYNVPSRTGVNIAPETISKLAEIENVVAIKESCSDINHFLDCAKVCNEVGLDMYCGDDGLTTAAMAMGASGVISVAANVVPRYIVELVRHCENNDYKRARALQFKLNEFIHSLFCEVNPIPVKKAMQLIGIDVGAPRLPLTELEEEHTKRLEAAMREVGLI